MSSWFNKKKKDNEKQDDKKNENDKGVELKKQGSKDKSNQNQNEQVQQPKNLPKNNSQILAQEDVWLFESLLQFISSPNFKVPLQDFIDENCLLFENIQNIEETHTEIHQNYKNQIDFLIIQIASDLEQDPEKLKDLCLLGLSSQYKKYFWYFQIYYHIPEFMKVMAKRNVDLESQALNDMAFGVNQKNPNFKLQNQQSIDQEFENVFSENLQLEEQRKQKIVGIENKNQEDLEKALALSKLEHDEYLRKLKEMEEDEFQRALRLSEEEERNRKNKQSTQQINEQKNLNYQQQMVNQQAQQQDYNTIQIQQQSQNQQYQQKKFQQEEIKQNDLISFNDNEDNNVQYKEGAKDNQIKKEFDDMIFQARLNNQQRLDTLTEFEEGQKQQMQQESLDERKERLKKQRELLLQKKKQMRDVELQEFNKQNQIQNQQQNFSNQQQNISNQQQNISNQQQDKALLQKRNELYSKIKGNLGDNKNN